jgi:hypothetical protein
VPFIDGPRATPEGELLSAGPHCNFRSLRQIAFSVKPILHRIPQLGERYSFANFDYAVRHREGVVEHAGIGKTTHGKTIKPFQWAWESLAFVFVFHEDFAGKHLRAETSYIAGDGAAGDGVAVSPLTKSLSSLLGLKKGIFFAGTSTRSPVFGLRPTRGLR